MQPLVTKLGNALAQQTSRLTRTAKAFIIEPEPKSIGDPVRASQIIKGKFLLGGVLVETQIDSIWDIKPPNEAFNQELHGFNWLDHLMANGTKSVKNLAQNWVWQWIDKFNSGYNIGWTPHLTGRRVLRLILYAPIILQEKKPPHLKKYLRSLSRQAHFLSRRWMVSPQGMPRFEALVGMVYCGLVLENKQKYLQSALQNLGIECQIYIQKNGGIASRNPEELAKIFTLLTWAMKAVNDAGYQIDQQHLSAIKRIIPTLRALRLGNGALAQFHGSGRGNIIMIDTALADAGATCSMNIIGGMGYARLAQSGTIIIMDIGAKPKHKKAHDSALAFEMSANQQPIFTNIGPGHHYGNTWHIVSTQKSAHNGLSINIQSQNSTPKLLSINADKKHHFMQKFWPFKKATIKTKATYSEDIQYQTLLGEYQGYTQLYGLTHHRYLDLACDGTILHGYDQLICKTETNRTQFQSWIVKNPENYLLMSCHFHVPPEINLQPEKHTNTVKINLPDNSSWIFQAQTGTIKINPSSSIERQRLQVSSSQQIIVYARIKPYETGIHWRLSQL